MTIHSEDPYKALAIAVLEQAVAALQDRRDPKEIEFFRSGRHLIWCECIGLDPDAVRSRLGVRGLLTPFPGKPPKPPKPHKPRPKGPPTYYKKSLVAKVEAVLPRTPDAALSVREIDDLSGVGFKSAQNALASLRRQRRAEMRLAYVHRAMAALWWRTENSSGNIDEIP